MATDVLLRSRDRATTVLTVLAFALPHAVLLAVIGGVLTFVERQQNPTNDLMGEGFYLFLAGFAAVLLVIPALTMGAAAARLGLSRRARDLAVLRLLGLPPAQAKTASVAETSLHASAGVVLGSVIYAVTLPAWQAIRFQSTPMRPGEMWIGPWLLVGAAVVMVVLAAASAWLAMRRVAITPLGVARRSDMQRVSPVGAVLVVVILVAWVGTAKMIMGMSVAVAMAAVLGFLAVVFALTNLVGAWSVGVLGRAMARAARRPQMLLAGRRIVDDPKAVWRSFGSVALVGFIVGVLFPMFSMMSQNEGSTSGDDAVMMVDVATGMLLTLGITFVLAAISTAVNQSIRVIDTQAETRVLVFEGAPTRFLDFSRRLEVAVPAVIMIGGGVLAGMLFMLPIAVSANLVGAVAGVLGFVVVGVVLILQGSEATRPLRERLLREAVA